MRYSVLAAYTYIIGSANHIEIEERLNYSKGKKRQYQNND